MFRGVVPVCRRVGSAVLVAMVVFGALFSSFAAEVIPPVPTQYFNDYAGVVSRDTAGRLNGELEAFEKQTSSQVLVAVFRKMQSNSSIEDYTVRIAQSWKVGQKAKDNGAVLFVFVDDRAVYIQVGYGLEGALPDALAKRIIEDEITPRFRAGDFDGGLTAGVRAILAATRGEYTGTGSTGSRGAKRPGASLLIILVLVLVAFVIVRSFIRGITGGAMGRRRGWSAGTGGWSGGGWGGGWGGGGFGGGGFGGGGGFSGGGGSFGGGGAGGRW